MKTRKYIIGLLSGMSLLTTQQTIAQIASLNELSNAKSYTISQLPDAETGARTLYATDTKTVETGVTTSVSDVAVWAVYTSVQTGYRYLYNLGTSAFLTNTTGGCTVSETALPCFFIETAQPGCWMLLNNDLVTGLAEENNGIFFTKNTDFDAKDLSFSLTDANRPLTASELQRIEQLVNAAEGDPRAEVLTEIETLLAEAQRVEQLNKPDFAGNYRYEELETAYNQADSYSVEQLETLLEQTKATVYPEEGKFYRLINKNRPNNGSMNNILTICDELKPMNLGARNITEVIPGKRINGVLDPISLFQVVRIGNENTYTLYHPGSRLYAGTAESNGTKIPLLENKAETEGYNLQHVEDFIFRFQNRNNSSFYMTANGESNCVSYNQEEEPEKWYFQEVTSINLQIGSSGYATLCLPCAIELPEEVEAYVATSQENDVLQLDALAEYTGNRVVPRYVPVILKRSENSNQTDFVCPIVYNATTPAITNLLKGITLQGSIEDGSYILYQGTDNGVGFYKIDPADNVLNSNKAYLPALTSSEQALKVRFGGEATEISLPEIIQEHEKDEILYDLTGKRVVRPGKGIYITTKGKKVVFK